MATSSWNARRAVAAAGLAAGLSLAPTLTAVAAPADPGSDPGSGAGRTSTPHALVLHRNGPTRTFCLDAPRGGEALVDFTAAARGADWSVKGRESAVLEVSIDGKVVTDVVITSDRETPRSIALGTLSPGMHTVTVRFEDAMSAPGVSKATVRDIAVRLSEPSAKDNAILAHAPVVVGRTLPALGSAAQNATTDTPLLAWHETLPAKTPGHTIVEYSVVWSNEDGGTNTPALMARWGRTTDIEWIYRVELDEHGKRVAGSDVYQAPEHATLHFTGTYEGEHPVLQTCTSNNNMCDVVTVPPKEKAMRFFLAADETRAADRARESLMDAHPWTYQVMAAEMTREGKVENPASTTTPEMSDQRNYLFAEVRKQTGAATGVGSVPGVTLGVVLKGDPTVYRSDHKEPSWTVTRDDPAATTVELPAGTTANDIASVVAIRRPSGVGDNGAPVTVLGINRAFFLGADRLPMASFLKFDTKTVLTKDTPTATIWSR